MKKKSEMFSIIFCGISVIGFLCFLILAQVFRDKEYLGVVFFSMAGFCLLVAIIIFCFLVKHWSRTKSIEEVQKENISKKVKAKNIFIIKSDGALTEEYLSKTFFSEYFLREAEVGHLLFKTNPSIYNKEEEALTCVLFVKESWNSLDFDTELAKRKELMQKINNAFNFAYKHINCLIVNLYSKLDLTIKDFYKKFIGYNDIEIEDRSPLKKQKIVKCIECNDCAIDSDTGECVFFQADSIATGLEADLSWLIIRALHLK